MDSFNESALHDFQESDLHERESGPDCPATGITSEIITWPTISGRPGWSNPTYPFGRWRIRLELTVNTPSTYVNPSVFSDAYRTICIIMARCKNGDTSQMQVFYPAPPDDVKVGTVVFTSFGTLFWRVPTDFPNAGYSFIAVDPFQVYITAPVIVSTLSAVAIVNGDAGHYGGAFYTWAITAFPSETYPKRFTSEIVVREQTPWCNSVFFPIQWGAGAGFDYSITINRES